MSVIVSATYNYFYQFIVKKNYRKLKQKKRNPYINFVFIVKKTEERICFLTTRNENYSLRLTKRN